MGNTQQKWDRYSINAEVRRKGLTLTGIAQDAGLPEAACRQGVLGSNRRGAEAIAKALKVPFRDLFPDSYSKGRHAEERARRKKNKPAKVQDTAAA